MKPIIFKKKRRAPNLSRSMLLDILRQAALQEGRSTIVIEQLHQAQDHPVHLAITETDYLKGFIARV